MWTRVLLLLFLICMRDNALSVRISELRVPAHVAEGSQALLGCQYEMEDDSLYSVKWYKDGREFFRYVPLNDPPQWYFDTAGVEVDLARSSSDVVTLVNLTAESAGLYRCEVSGEAPFFTTVFDQKYISVHLLPSSPPLMTGLNDEYQFGDRAVVNCSSPPARPETRLKWWINDRPAPRDHLQGPWYRVAVDRPDATETILQLRFTVMAKHFQDGVMKLKCQAMIAPLYQDETVRSLARGAPEAVHSDVVSTEDSTRIPEDFLPFHLISNTMPKRDTDQVYPGVDTDSADTSRLALITVLAHFIGLAVL